MSWRIETRRYRSPWRLFRWRWEWEVYHSGFGWAGGEAATERGAKRAALQAIGEFEAPS